MATRPKPPRDRRPRIADEDFDEIVWAWWPQPSPAEVLARVLDELDDMLPWRAAAACRGRPIEPFFSTDPDEQLAAISSCRRCPVRVECLIFALSLGPADRHGVMGGTTARERRSMRRVVARRRELAVNGNGGRAIDV